MIVTGTGFGATQDTSTLTFASIPAVVTSWSNTSIIASVPAEASSGPVVVTVAGSSSNGLNFTVLSPLPQISSLMPNTGEGGTTVTLSGAHFGATQGSSTLTFNDIPATVGTWSDTEITATAPTGLSAGTVPVVVTENNQKSNGLGFTIPLTAAASSITVSPPTLSMVVGDTQQISVVDNFGRVVSGASLSVTDTTVVQLSTDGQQVLSALAVGATTVTATYGNFSAKQQVTVYAGPGLPQGTVRWSVPPTPGYSTTKIVQSLTRDWSVPDFYVVEDGNGSGFIIHGVASDGHEMWHSPLPGSMGSPSIRVYLMHASGDATGGFLMEFEDNNGNSLIIRLDGVTGQETWRYYSGGGLYQDWAVGSDDTIYVVEVPGGIYGNQSATNPNSKLLAINGANGTIHFSVPYPPSAWVRKSQNCVAGNDYASYWSSAVGAPMIAPDGSVNLELTVTNRLDDDTQCGSPVSTVDTNIQLLQLPASGGPSFSTIYDYTGFSVSLYPGEVIPDGQGGLLVAWTSVYEYSPQAELTHVTPAGNAQYTLSQSSWWNDFHSWTDPPDSNLVLGENGTAFARLGGTVISFDIASGTPHWTWTGASQMIAATSGNGLTVRTSNQVVRLDPTGAATYDTWTGAQIDYYAGDVWTNNAGASGVMAYSAAPVNLGNSVWVQPSNEGTRQGAPDITVTDAFQTNPNQGAIASVLSAIGTALYDEEPSILSCAGWLQGQGTTTGSSVV